MDQLIEQFKKDYFELWKSAPNRAAQLNMLDHLSDLSLWLFQDVRNKMYYSEEDQHAKK